MLPVSFRSGHVADYGSIVSKSILDVRFSLHVDNDMEETSVMRSHLPSFTPVSIFRTFLVTLLFDYVGYKCMIAVKHYNDIAIAKATYQFGFACLKLLSIFTYSIAAHVYCPVRL